MKKCCCCCGMGGTKALCGWLLAGGLLLLGPPKARGGEYERERDLESRPFWLRRRGDRDLEREE